MVGTGFTVTVKVVGGPLQPLSLGVTVMVDVWGEVTFAEVSAKGPLPVAGIPVAVLLFVQLNVAVGIEPVNSAAIGSPAQSTWVGTALTVGWRPILMLNVSGLPGQAPKAGCTTTTADWAFPVGDWVVNVKPAVVPLAARPMSGLLLVHAYCVPVGPLKFTATDSPTHFNTS